MKTNQVSFFDKYEGNIKHCSECKYCTDFSFIDDKKVYRPCKMIDHNKIRLYTHIFGGYECSKRMCPICKYFEPAIWDLSAQNSWKGIEPYIEFLEGDVYRQYVLLCVGKYDCYGEYQYRVRLLDWLTGEAIQGNKIKYRSKWKVIRYPSGKPKKAELIELNGVELVHNT